MEQMAFNETGDNEFKPMLPRQSMPDSNSSNRLGLFLIREALYTKLSYPPALETSQESLKYPIVLCNQPLGKVTAGYDPESVSYKVIFHDGASRPIKSSTFKGWHGYWNETDLLYIKQRTVMPCLWEDEKVGE